MSLLRVGCLYQEMSVFKVHDMKLMRYSLLEYTTVSQLLPLFYVN